MQDTADEDFHHTAKLKKKLLVELKLQFELNF